MSRITVTKITTQFLSGNLFESIEDYDVKASAELYAAKCWEALENVYVGAEIIVSYQEGREPLAHGLMETLVVFSDGSVQKSENGGDAEIVDDICEGVYNEQEWLVESD